MSRFANLGTRLAANPKPDVPDDEDLSPPTPAVPPVEGEPVPEDDEDEEEHPNMADKTAVEETAEYKAGLAAGRTAALSDFTAVAASEEFKGREAHGIKLLGKGMASADVIDVLADMPRAVQATEEELRAAAEEAGRKEMKEAMQGRGNADLGADKDSAPDPKKDRAATDAAWDKARAAAQHKGVK